MANKDQNLTLNEGNTEKVNLTIVTNDPVPNTPMLLDQLTDIEVLLKPSEITPDSDASVWRGKMSDGDVVITDAGAGKCYVKIPASAVTTTRQFWRVDTVSGSERKTAGGGTVTVVDW